MPREQVGAGQGPHQTEQAHELEHVGDGVVFRGHAQQHHLQEARA